MYVCMYVVVNCEFVTHHLCGRLVFLLFSFGRFVGFMLRDCIETGD